MILKILLISFTVLLLWIFFVPVIIQADTARKRFRVLLPGVISAAVVSNSALFKIRFWIFFVPFSIDPFSRGNATRKRRKNDGKQGKKKKRRGGLLQGIRNGRKFRRVLRAIRVKRFHMDIDTDDFVLNAQLSPVFALASNHQNVHLRTNFQGDMYFSLDVRVRMGVAIWMLLMSKISSGNHMSVN